MNNNEQSPHSAGQNPDEMPPLWSTTPGGRWRVDGTFSLPESSSRGPASAEDFLSSLGLGEGAASGVAQEDTSTSNFGPISVSGDDVRGGQSSIYSAPDSQASIHPNQFVATDKEEEDTQLVFGDTIRAADETDTSTETEEAVEEAAPTEPSDTELQTPPAPPAEEEDKDFGDPLALEAQRARKRGHFDGLQAVQPTRDAEQAGLPGSVVRRRPDLRPRWQRPPEED